MLIVVELFKIDVVRLLLVVVVKRSLPSVGSANASAASLFADVAGTAFSSKPEDVDTEAMENPPELPQPLFRNFTLELDLTSPEQNIEVPAEAQGHGLTDPGAPRRSNEP